jgi:hypothetical protein
MTVCVKKIQPCFNLHFLKKILQLFNNLHYHRLLSTPIFATEMKRIAFLLFIIFATVQLAPAVMAFFPKATSIFLVDEEKAEDKGSISADNFKEKKDYADFSPLSTTFALKLTTAFHLTEKIHPSPYPENQTPPPNFC